MLDTSGSMEQLNRITIAKKAAKTVVETLNPNDRVIVINDKFISMVIKIMMMMMKYDVNNDNDNNLFVRRIDQHIVEMCKLCTVFWCIPKI